MKKLLAVLASIAMVFIVATPAHAAPENWNGTSSDVCRPGVTGVFIRAWMTRYENLYNEDTISFDGRSGYDMEVWGTENGNDLLWTRVQVWKTPPTGPDELVDAAVIWGDNPGLYFWNGPEIRADRHPYIKATAAFDVGGDHTCTEKLSWKHNWD